MCLINVRLILGFDLHKPRVLNRIKDTVHLLHCLQRWLLSLFQVCITADVDVEIVVES